MSSQNMRGLSRLVSILGMCHETATRLDIVSRVSSSYSTDFFDGKHQVVVCLECCCIAAYPDTLAFRSVALTSRFHARLGAAPCEIIISIITPMLGSALESRMTCRKHDHGLPICNLGPSGHAISVKCTLYFACINAKYDRSHIRTRKFV